VIAQQKQFPKKTANIGLTLQNARIAALVLLPARQKQLNKGNICQEKE
jgi:hypothetical protein